MFGYGYAYGQSLNEQEIFVIKMIVQGKFVRNSVSNPDPHEYSWVDGGGLFAQMAEEINKLVGLGEVYFINNIATLTPTGATRYSYIH